MVLTSFLLLHLDAALLTHTDHLSRHSCSDRIVRDILCHDRAIADRILFIENGTVVEQSDDPKAFFASPETDRAKAFLKSFDYE